MAKLLITLTVAVLLLNGLTFLIVVTQEPEIAKTEAQAEPEKPKTPQDSPGVRAITTQLGSVARMVDGISSTSSQVLQRLQTLERRVASLEKLLHEEPAAAAAEAAGVEAAGVEPPETAPPAGAVGPSPTSGPERVDYSRPPEGLELTPETPQDGGEAPAPGEDAQGNPEGDGSR
jgi:hypothetical protein